MIRRAAAPLLTYVGSAAHQKRPGLPAILMSIEYALRVLDATVATEDPLVAGRRRLYADLLQFASVILLPRANFPCVANLARVESLPALIALATIARRDLWSDGSEVREPTLTEPNS